MMDKSDLTIESVDDENPRSLVFDFSMIFAVLVLVLTGMIWAYLRSPKVADKVFGGPEQFGQFGDFIGGLANPLIGICTLGLVMWTITIQRQTLAETRKELNLTRGELIKSNELLAKQHLFADREHKLKLLESAADRQIDEFEKALHVNTIEFSKEFWGKYGAFLSIDDKAKNPGRNSVSNLASFLFLSNGHREMEKVIFSGLDSEYKCLSRAQVNFLIKLCKLVYVFSENLSEMNNLLPSTALQKYWQDKLDEYEAIFAVLMIDYVKTSEHGRIVLQSTISD